jgi:hypothetical protein
MEAKGAKEQLFLFDLEFEFDFTCTPPKPVLKDIKVS